MAMILVTKLWSSEGFLISGMVADMRLAIITFLCALTVASCSAEPSCQNEQLVRSTSPDGRKVAVAFLRDCGATTDENYQVSVSGEGERLPEKGNVLIVDQVPTYSDAFKPVWNEDGSLMVPVPRGARVFLKRNNLDGIHVIFQDF